MKVKALLSKMARDGIEEVCIEKGWRLPTFEEADKYINEIEHESFWIQGYGDSVDIDSGKIEQRPLYYEMGKGIH